MATTYLYRDATGDVGVQKATISTWVKRSNVTEQQYIYFCGYTANYSSYNFYIRFETDGTLTIISNDGGVILNYNTNRVFRETSGWYQIVVALDLTETGNDRCKLYVNGVLETSYATQTAMTGDQWITGKSGYRLFIGYSPDATTKVWNGLMSSFYYTDGYVYQASTFGETDATTGEWKINTAPSVTMGTLGFLVMENGNTITDQSSNSNDLTLGAGTLTATEDCPSDVFCTWNSIQTRPYDTPTYSNGNTTVTRSGANWAETTGSLGATKGKYYWEMKPTGTVSSNCFIGICSEAWQNSNRYADADPYNSTLGLVLYYQDGEKTVNGVTTASFFPSFAADDIIGIALDLDAATKTVTFYKNNSIAGSAIDLPANMQTGFVLPVSMFLGSVSVMSWNANFGNGYFGTTIISSEGTNASGIGKFEYDIIPSTATALSTKGLNS